MPSKGKQITIRRAPVRRQNALRLAKANRRKLNNIQESKYIDIDETAITTATAGVVIPLSQVATGSTDTSRIGEKIHGETLQLRIFEANLNTAQCLRIIVFTDKQQHGSSPVVANVLQGAGFLNMYARSNLERFHILRDYTIPNDKGTGDQFSKTFNIRLNRNIYYIGDAAAEASNGSGSVYMIVISYQTGSANSFRYTSRITFTE